MELLSSLKYKFSTNIPVNDRQAYQKYPKYQKFYSRFNIFKYQGKKVGRLTQTPPFFPVFIKPDVNLLGANQDCYLIRNYQELENLRMKFRNNKKKYQNLFWTEYIKGMEGSWDLILYKGNILFKTHHLIFHTDGFLEDYKIIGSETPFPNKFRNFVRNYFSDYTGILNIQYRGDTIIEVGLRFDGGGRFILVSQDAILINQINNFFENPKPLNFRKLKTSYVYKVSVLPPLLIVPPPFIIEHILPDNFKYHYYLEFGENKKSYLNIYTTNKELGKKKQKELEHAYYTWNFIMLLLIIYLFRRFPENYLFIILFILFMRYGFLKVSQYRRL